MIPQPQQEYVLTKESIEKIYDYANAEDAEACIRDIIAKESRPAPSAPNSQKIDFLAAIKERIIPNDGDYECNDFIPYPNDCCGMVECINENCIYHPNQKQHDATIRNQMLDELKNAFRIADEDSCGSPWTKLQIIKLIDEYQESLRREVPE